MLIDYNLDCSESNLRDCLIRSFNDLHNKQTVRIEIDSAIKSVANYYRLGLQTPLREAKVKQIVNLVKELKQLIGK